ncbi:MAG TPA: hypothetical protein VGJ91_06950, partial [Polyangiaceae bacterium]
MSAALVPAVGLGLLCCLAALPANAAISAQIPAECGSLSEFESELEQRLGNASAPEATRVTLTPEVSGYRLVVEAGNQRRELHDPSCQELLRAAIVIALALLDPKRDEVPPALAEPERRAPPASKAVGRAWPKVALAAGGGLHLGMLPHATLMLELDAQLKWARWGVATGFRYLLPAETVDENGHGAQIGAAGAYLAGLFEPWQRVQLRLGVAAYHLSASGRGTVDPQEGGAWELSP